MTEPVFAAHIMLATLSGAMIILFGAFYAFFFAWSRLKNSASHALLAYASYAVFAVFTLVLARALHLSGHWHILIGLILLGYWLAPYGVWRLCVSTHAHEKTQATTRTRQTRNYKFH